MYCSKELRLITGAQKGFPCVNYISGVKTVNYLISTWKRTVKISSFAIYLVTVLVLCEKPCEAVCGKSYEAFWSHFSL